MSESILIIGAGIAGLSAGCYGQMNGYQTKIFELHTRPGGLCTAWKRKDYTFDGCIHWLVGSKPGSGFYKYWAELGALQGKTLVNHEEFWRVEGPGDKVFIVYTNVDRLEKHMKELAPADVKVIEEFCGAIRAFTRFPDAPSDAARSLTDQLKGFASFIAMLPALGLFNKYKNLTIKDFADRFSDPFLRQALVDVFGYPGFAFLGLPMTLAWMHNHNAGYPIGGSFPFAQAIEKRYLELGGEVHYQARVEKILVENGRAVGVRLAGGEVVRADIVVSNADLVYTYKKLVPARYRKTYTDAKLDRMEYACSGYLLYLGVDKTYPHMRHQALYFSEDYRANLDAIFRTRTLPADPSFHLNNPTITDPSLAPPGHSVLYLLAPMPNLQGNVDWDAAAPLVREQLLGGLERLVDPEIRKHIVWEREYRPADFERDINAPYGVAFGSLSHGFFQSSYFRPHNVARDIPGLYFVGQGTYPGIGMPMVLLSARLLAERLAGERSSGA
jgi:phytoene desaturase